MNSITRKFMLFIMLLTVATACFALDDLWTMKIGLTGGDADIASKGRTDVDLGLSYELWFKKSIAVGLHPYVTQVHGGEGTGQNYKSYLTGGDLQLRVRPEFAHVPFVTGNITHVAPYINGGAGVVNFFPKSRQNYHIPQPANDKQPYTVLAAPVFGGGLTFFTTYGMSVDVGYQRHHIDTDWMDGLIKNGDNDAYWTFYLGFAFTDRTPKKKEVAPVKPAPVVTPPPVVQPKPTPVPEVKPTPAPIVPPPAPVVVPEPKPVPVQPVPVPVVPTPEPKVQFKKDVPLVLKGVNFKTGSAELAPEAGAVLDEVVASLKENPNVKLEIQGHTDNVGSAASNLNLSQRRAQSVMNYMVSKGIEASRLTAKGYGMTMPTADNNTAEGRAQNRRIAFQPID